MAIAVISPLFIGADIDVLYSGASIASSGEYLNNGTCTYVLTDDETQTVVSSGTVPYTTESDGDYAGVIQSTVTSTVEQDAAYTLTITFVSSDAVYNDERDIPLRGANVPCLILTGQGGERDEFGQSQRTRNQHTIAFSDYDGGVDNGDKLIDDNTGRTHRFTGDRPQQGVGGIISWQLITVTQLS